MKIINNYTLNDVLTTTIQRPIEQPSGYYDQIGFYLLFQQVLTLEYKNYMQLYGINVEDFCEFKVENNEQVINVTPYSKLLRLIKNRFGNHYFLECEEDFESINASYWFTLKPLKDICDKFIGIIISTHDKYINILNAYQSNIDKLMQPLKSKVNAKNLFNDTPQSTDVVATIEENQYVTNLSKNVVESENDSAYVIEKLKKLQDDYENVLFRWSEEFHTLFIEEEMI